MSGELIEVTLDGMAHGGSALGHSDDRVVFVPYTLPGETVQARIVQEKGRTVFAEGVTLLDASTDRVQPRCPHFGPGKCGRCHWQHIDYAAQLLLKQDVVADQLERIGGFKDAEVRPVIASPEQWGYNAGMLLEVARDGELGFMAASHKPSMSNIFPISECHILHPDLLALKESLDLERMAGLEDIILQRGSDGAEMIVIRMKEDQPPELETDLPMSVNMLLMNGQPVTLIGETHNRYTVKGRTFRATAGCFFRPNLSQMDNLVDAVLAALDLKGGEAVLELYAGVGVFTAFIAPRARLVTMVDSDPDGIADAEANLADLDNIDIIEGTVEDVLEALDEPYDVALLDPFTIGLTVDTTDQLGVLKIPRLVYLSSDPAKLARDGKRLAAQGYRLKYVQPIDLEPQAYYTDCIAVFERT